MNAIKFIQDNGVDKAREVVEGAPEGSTCYVFWTGKFRYINELTCEIYSEKLGGWCEANIMVLNLKNPLSELKRLVESVDIISKFDSVQEAKDAISNSPDGATDYRKLSCTIRYIKQSERFFEYWDGSIWCRPTVPFTEETHILRFTELSRLKQAIADYESIYGGEHV